MIFFVFLVSLLLLILVIIFQANFNNSKDPSAQEQSQKAEKQTCQLIEKTKLNHDTYQLKFALQSKMNDLGIQVGQYISLHHPNEFLLNNNTFQSTQLIRKISSEFEKDNQNGCKFNSWIENMNSGESALIKSPLGSFFYQGNGNTMIIKVSQRTVAKYKRIVMIAGESGIAPMYQISQAVANNNNDKTQLELLFANKTQQDILLYNELMAFAASKKKTLHLTLDKPPASWIGFSGFVTKSMIESAFGTFDKHTLALVCGPPKMRQLIRQIFHELKVSSTNVYMFA